MGVDPDFHTVETVDALEHTLKSLPAGATVKVRIASNNEAGDATPSPEATHAVP